MTDQTPVPTHIVLTVEQWDGIQLGWRRTVRALVRLVVAVLLVVGLFVGFIMWRSYKSQDRTECVTRTQAVGLGDLVVALKGTPADPERNHKLDRAATELAKLVDVGETCG